MVDAATCRAARGARGALEALALLAGKGWEADAGLVDL